MTAFWNKNRKEKLADLPKKKVVKDLAVASTATAIKDKTGKVSSIIIRPILTEKSTLVEKNNQYLFQVKTQATKPEVRKAVKSLYGVNAAKVNMVNVLGKKVRFGRHGGVQKNWKKAIVILKPGEKIEMYKN